MRQLRCNGLGFGHQIAWSWLPIPPLAQLLRQIKQIQEEQSHRSMRAGQQPANGTAPVSGSGDGDRQLAPVVAPGVGFVVGRSAPLRSTVLKVGSGLLFRSR